MLNNEVPVKIKVKTAIEGQETVELLVFGRFFQKDHASFLQYEEIMEEGTVRTIIKVAADEALVLRGGAVKMRLPFRMNEMQKGSYEMPFGVFETTTVARRIEYTYKNGGGLIDILYDFSMQGSPSSTYHLEITFQEERK